MSQIDDQAGFKNFTSTLEEILKKYDTVEPKDLLRYQRKQIRDLVATEDKFRKKLVKHRWGKGVYRDFVEFICNEKKNILAARPYFRERQTTFTSQISPVLKNRDWKGLQKFHFNWGLIDWVLKSRKWAANAPIRVLAGQVQGHRQSLLEQNLPLAISQARIFWRKTPKSHLTYMDIVQIQCQGLLLAIDKFVPPNEKLKKLSERQSLKAYQSFRAVAIGIMTRDRVNHYSEKLLHFFPKDRQKIYIANKYMKNFAGEVDYAKLAEWVNFDLRDAGFQTTPEELASLLAGSSTVSGDYSTEPDSDTILEKSHGPEELQPDQAYEQREVSAVLHLGIQSLLVKERKLIRLKGVM